MARITALFTLILAFCCTANAQVTKALSIKTAKSCNAGVYGGDDIDNRTNYGTGRYFAYMDGCTAKVFEIPTAQDVFSLDLEGVGVNTESQYSYVTLYRNLLASDGKWTAIYYELTSTNPFSYTVSVIAGNSKQVLSTTATNAPSLNLDGSNLYIVVTEPDRVDFYIARNNVSLASLPRLEMPKREHASKGLNLWSDVNPLGQKLTDGSLSKNIKLLR